MKQKLNSVELPVAEACFVECGLEEDRNVKKHDRIAQFVCLAWGNLKVPQVSHRAEKIGPFESDNELLQGIKAIVFSQSIGGKRYDSSRRQHVWKKTRMIAQKSAHERENIMAR